MAAVSVKNLSKHYQVHQKEPGITGSIKSLFCRKYETVKAVENVSFEIDEGNIVGFIGPNGAGKTTTLKCLSGLLYPTKGRVKVLGFTPWERKPQFQKQMSLVMGQKNQLWWDLPPLETFVLNREIYEIPQDQYQSTLSKLVDLLDVHDILNIQVRKLSLGQRMKCELIAALLHTPKILFLDEPTIGLDVVMQKVMRDFIRDYNSEFNSTIILTSHYMDDVKELAKRVIIIDRGQILFDGELQKVIDRYARNKIITLAFSKQIARKDLENFGMVKEFNLPSAKIVVPRKNSAKISSQILAKLPVADLTIEEPSMDAIIREVFTKQKKKAQ